MRTTPIPENIVGRRRWLGRNRPEGPTHTVTVDGRVFSLVDLDASERAAIAAGSPIWVEHVDGESPVILSTDSPGG